MAQQNVGNPLVLSKSAHIHGVVDTLHCALVGILPQSVVCAIVKFGCRFGVSGDKKRIFLEVRCQIFVVERRHGVNHRAAIVVLAHHLDKYLQAIHYLLWSPVATLLDVDERHKVLLLGLHRAGEILKLRL